MKNARSNCWAFLAICFVLTTLGRAQQPQFVGITSSAFVWVPAIQKQSEWTWAAGVQMILTYYGLEVNQREIVPRLFSGPPVESTTEALTGEGFEKQGRIRTIYSHPVEGMLPPAMLLSELSQQRPVLVLSGPQSEASVITAASYIGSPEVPTIVGLITRAPDSDLSAVDGRVELSGQQLGYWMS